MNWFRRFMYGRYGSDQLNFALIIFSILLSLTARFSHSSILYIISNLILLICFVRMFSKNIQKRYRENLFFKAKFDPIKNKIVGIAKGTNARKTHKFLKCPKCRQKIRVPKGRGKIKITCPNCKDNFIKKT